MKKVLTFAWPIMLSYVPIGLACGILGMQAGVTPLRGLLLSLTVISGGGQFMINNLWLAGLPVASIVASVGAVSLRFALYSASLAPYLQKARKRTSLAMALTLIEEAYGVTLSKLSSAEKDDWTFSDALLLNVLTIAAWAASVVAGGLLGQVVNVPTAVASFAMTSLFVYLLWSQLTDGEKGLSHGNLVAAIAAAMVVVICKLAGWTAVAVPLAAVAGVAVAFLGAHSGGRNGTDAAGEKGGEAA